MSYEVHLSGDISIPKRNTTKATGALKNLVKKLAKNNKNDYGTAPEILKDKDAGYILEYLGFDTETDVKGNLHILSYNNYEYDSQDILRAIAPYALKKSVMNGCGEDGRMWKWVFKTGQMEYKNI